jgi:DNA modification methylase
MSEQTKTHCSHTIHRPIGELQEHPRNPNHHSKEQVALLAKIIREQGWRNPIVVSTRSGYIVAGHARLQAAKTLGLETVPVDEQDFESEENELAHLMADNRIAELAEINEDEIKELLRQLDGQIDLDLTGFDQTSIEDLLKELEDTGDPEDAEPQLDKAAELQAKWGTEPGQVWRLGDHRIACGSCTDSELIASVLDSEQPDMMFTDPPYGVGYSGRGEQTSKTIANDEIDDHALRDLLDGMFERAFAVLKDGACVYVCHAEATRLVFGAAFDKAGFRFSSNLIWVKNVASMGWQDYRYRHEPILYGWKPGSHFNAGDRAETSVWEVARESGYLHPTTKPVELVMRALRNSSEQGDIVYEPFSGSGSTLIACENMGRKCRAIELAPEYVAVAIQRWHDLTGEDPELC